jgi:hypothetical protein
VLPVEVPSANIRTSDKIISWLDSSRYSADLLSVVVCLKV